MRGASVLPAVAVRAESSDASSLVRGEAAPTDARCTGLLVVLWLVVVFPLDAFSGVMGPLVPGLADAREAGVGEDADEATDAAELEEEEEEEEEAGGNEEDDERRCVCAVAAATSPNGPDTNAAGRPLSKRLAGPTS